MLVLFDHGTPKGLAGALPGHTIHTAQARGWDTLSNGALLNAAEEGYRLRGVNYFVGRSKTIGGISGAWPVGST